MDLSGINKDELFCELQRAFYELSNRGLVRAARWAADALAGLELPDDQAELLAAGVEPPRLGPVTSQAKAYFDSHEFLRCWNILETARARRPASPRGVDRFLRLFARYHAGEAQKEDAMGTEIFVDRTKEGGSSKAVLNPYLEELAAELAAELGSDPGVPPGAPSSGSAPGGHPDGQASTQASARAGSEPSTRANGGPSVRASAEPSSEPGAGENSVSRTPATETATGPRPFASELGSDSSDAMSDAGSHRDLDDGSHSHHEGGSSPAPEDPFLLYLDGVVLRARKRNDAAIARLARSVRLYPFNWSCWMELRACFTKLVEIQAVLDDLERQFAARPAAHRVMLALFRCFASEELDPAASSQLLVRALIPLFPRFQCLYTQLARIYNGEGHYEAAAALFERVLASDPYRIEDLDVYSNLLYVTEQRSKLAYLAHHVAATDKYRTEACCIIANYYSLVGEHEKAVQHYQRAILLDTNYISAWTLMGHEFIELGNPHAAIETYRRAIDLAAFDFRPWFGLGQAYEVLSMYFFAQYYFQRALALRPGDVRLWDALGNCYEQLGRDADAVNAFRQAYLISDGEDYYTYRLGMLLDRLGDTDAALKHITACALSTTAAPAPTISAAVGALPQPAPPAGLASASLASASLASSTTLASAAPPHPAASASLADDTLGGPNVTAPLTSLADPDLEEASEWPVRARLWLAKRAMSLGKWSEALSWARRIDHGTREMLEEARSLEREARVQAQNADGTGLP